jgi:hypothetical protein
LPARHLIALFHQHRLDLSVQLRRELDVLRPGLHAPRRRNQELAPGCCRRLLIFGVTERPQITVAVNPTANTAAPFCAASAKADAAQGGVSVSS